VRVGEYLQISREAYNESLRAWQSGDIYMPQTVSERVYEAFWDNLAKSKGIRQETIAALKVLYRAGKLADKKALTNLATQIEARHAQNQGADS